MNARKAAIVTALALVVPAYHRAARAEDLPKIDGRAAVASVNGAGIFLDDLEREIAALHAGRGDDEQAGHRQNPSLLLERMITAELLSQEARNIGLDGQPEAKRQFERIRLETLRDLLLARAAKEIGPPDPAVVEGIFRNAVGEYRVRSILIQHEADANDLSARVKAGGSFDALASALVSAGKAREGISSEWLKGIELQPEVALALSRMKTGEVGSVFKVGPSWSVFKLLEARFPENREARERAQAIAADEKRRDGLEAYTARLRAAHATIDRRLLDSLDYDEKGAITALEKDPRPLATIRCGKDVTVGDLTAAISDRYFHGADKAVEMRRVNREKAKLLDDVLNRRVVECEAARLGLESTREYKARVARAQSAYLFGAFVRKAVVPDVEVEEDDLAAYLAAHAGDFQGEETLRLDAIAFVERGDAEAAVSKLNRGSDFDWTRANAPGRAKADDPRLLELPATPVATSSLPEEVRKAVAEARPGEVRFCEGERGLFYALRLEERIPGRALPLEAVREKVRGLVYQEKLTRLVDEWGAKLREASDVKVFATGDALTRFVMRDLSAGS